MLIVELMAQRKDTSYYNQTTESLWRGHNAKRLTAEYKQDAKIGNATPPTNWARLLLRQNARKLPQM